MGWDVGSKGHSRWANVKLGPELFITGIYFYSVLSGTWFTWVTPSVPVCHACSQLCGMKCAIRCLSWCSGLMVKKHIKVGVFLLAAIFFSSMPIWSLLSCQYMHFIYFFLQSCGIFRYNSTNQLNACPWDVNLTNIFDDAKMSWNLLKMRWLLCLFLWCSRLYIYIYIYKYKTYMPCGVWWQKCHSQYFGVTCLNLWANLKVNNKVVTIHSGCMLICIKQWDVVSLYTNCDTTYILLALQTCQSEVLI